MNRFNYDLRFSKSVGRSGLVSRTRFRTPAKADCIDMIFYWNFVLLLIVDESYHFSLFSMALDHFGGRAPSARRRAIPVPHTD